MILVLPRVMADDEVTAEDLAALGQGGLCLNCPVCTFPTADSAKGCREEMDRMEFTHLMNRATPLW